MIFAFDVDGTLGAHPVVLGALMRALVAAGHEAVVLTGTGTVEGRTRQLADLGLADAYSRLVVMPGPSAAEVAVQKGEWCRENVVALMVEDQIAYARECAAGGALALLICPAA